MTGVLLGLAAVPLIFALFLCFVAGTRRTLDRKWRRFIIGALVLASLGWLMAVFTGYTWGYKEVRGYYIRLLQEMTTPRRSIRPPVDKNVLET